MRGNIWPVVAIFAIGLGAIVSILLFVPESNAAASTAVVAILAMLAPVLGGIWVAKHVTNEVEQVKAEVGEVAKQVNGRMSQLIDKKTLPDDDWEQRPETD